MASINATCSCDSYGQAWSWTSLATYTTLAVSVAMNIFFLWKRYAPKTVPIKSQIAPLKPLTKNVTERHLSHSERIEQLKADKHAVVASRGTSIGEGVVVTSSPYDSLLCDHEYTGYALEVFGYLADNSYGSMIWNIRVTVDTLSGTGKKMEDKGVHPLKLIELMATHQPLKKAMRLIFKDSLKRGSVIDAPGVAKPLLKKKGLSCGIKAKLDGCTDLQKYFNGFVQALGLNKHEVAQVQAFFQVRNWEGLIKFLIDR